MYTHVSKIPSYFCTEVVIHLRFLNENILVTPLSSLVCKTANFSTLLTAFLLRHITHFNPLDPETFKSWSSCCDHIMAADLTTADVYEDASLIGQDIEKIIERFGHDAMMDLMPKVIRVLEKLEIVVGEREKDKLEIAELKLENERLYLDIKREASQRRKLDEVGLLLKNLFHHACAR